MRKSSCACGGGCPGCQSAAGLKISEPHDPAEIEADRLADQVMRMPIGGTSGSADTPASTHNHVETDEIHRKCDACEEEELEEPVMRKEANLAADAQPPEPPPGSGDKPPSINSVIAAGGVPLDLETRRFFEPRFGIDLGHVRVHTDANAELSARSINARAYTLGSNIVFAGGAYLPLSESGRNLLAHELAHVAQQPNSIAMNRYAARKSTQSVDGEMIFRAPDDFLESPSQDTGEGGGTKAAECPKVPTKLGDLIPEPSCPTATHIGTNEVTRINFCLDSDRPINNAHLKKIADTVSKAHPKTRFLIHGYASPEGNKKYNFNLACHRANRIADAFFEPIRTQVLKRIGSSGDEGQKNQAVGTEFLARVETAAQGPTNKFGKPEENRLVIVYKQVPAATADDEPSCEEAHGKIGDIKPELAPDLATVNLNGSKPTEHLAHFRFCKDSDVLKRMTPADVRKFAHAQASKTVFVVHGFASEEGDPEYNLRLSHHRALRIARELINAGVRPEQVRQVSAIGETNKFGDDDANRVVVVQARGGAVDELEDSKHEAKTEDQKQAIIDEARGRLIAGQYNLKADAYISFWTCGRTRTVSQAVERLTIHVKPTNEREIVIKQANGAEEGEGVNTVIMSNVALRADNGVECTMGRLVDMAFHHSEIDNPDLGGNRDFRHSAGLHLIHLAGFGPCLGEDANPTIQIGSQKGGIDKPVEDDPRKNIRIPLCAETPEPTRLHFPIEGVKDRSVPEFTFDKAPADYELARGQLNTNFDPKADNKGATKRRLVTFPAIDVLKAKANLKLKGDPATFADYEVGFIQSVIADQTQADYSSGHSVIQELPAPIRMGARKGEVPVPEPWTTLDSMAVPKPDGSVSISTFGIRLDSEAAIGIQQLNEKLPLTALTAFEHSSRIAIWLVARRRGAPLDRFSVRFIDGVTYDLIQTCHIEHRHVKGELSQPFASGVRRTVNPELGGEGEITAFVGGFLSNNKSELPADPSLMRFRGAVASDIGLLNQIKEIVEPSAPTQGMGKLKLTAVLRDILDNLEVFESVPEAATKTGGKTMRRLGFDFVPLTITLPIVRSTGRVKSPENEQDIPVKVDGPGLGFFAKHHLAKAIDFRIRDRRFQGQEVVVEPSILEGDAPDIGTVTITLPPLPREPDKPEQEVNLLKRSGDVLQDMAEAWACTEKTKKMLDPREFGAAYFMDRTRTIHKIPGDRLKMGFPEEPDGSFKLDLPCADDPDGVNLGSFHTHPEPDPTPSDKDAEYVEKCSPRVQHFIITENRVFRISLDGKSVTDMQVSLPQGKVCRPINLEGPPEGKKKKTDDDEFE